MLGLPDLLPATLPLALGGLVPGNASTARSATKNSPQHGLRARRCLRRGPRGWCACACRALTRSAEPMSPQPRRRPSRPGDGLLHAAGVRASRPTDQAPLASARRSATSGIGTSSRSRRQSRAHQRAASRTANPYTFRFTVQCGTLASGPRMPVSTTMPARPARWRTRTWMSRSRTSTPWKRRSSSIAASRCAEDR